VEKRGVNRDKVPPRWLENQKFNSEEKTTGEVRAAWGGGKRKGGFETGKKKKGKPTKGFNTLLIVEEGEGVRLVRKAVEITNSISMSKGAIEAAVVNEFGTVGSGRVRSIRVSAAKKKKTIHP